jgi:hypothetical protein
VVAEPWAEVYIDGKLFAVTAPRLGAHHAAARAVHFLKLVNPHFEPASRELRITQGETMHVEVKLIEKARPPAHAGAETP